MSADITMAGLAQLLGADCNDYRFTISHADCYRGVHTVTITEHRSRKTFTGSHQDLVEAWGIALDRATRYRDACDEERAA